MRPSETAVVKPRWTAGYAKAIAMGTAPRLASTMDNEAKQCKATKSLLRAIGDIVCEEIGLCGSTGPNVHGYPMLVQKTDAVRRADASNSAARGVNHFAAICMASLTRGSGAPPPRTAIRTSTRSPA